MEISTIELGRAIAAMMPVMRARKEIGIQADDVSLGFAIARRMEIEGLRVFRRAPDGDGVAFHSKIGETQKGQNGDPEN